MIFYIEDSVLEALSAADEEAEKWDSVLESLAFAVRRGRHKIAGPRKSLAKISRHYGNTEVGAVLAAAWEELAETGMVLRRVSVVGLLSAAGPSSEVPAVIRGKVIVRVASGDDPLRVFCENSKLLTENVADADFFVSVARHFFSVILGGEVPLEIDSRGVGGSQMSVEFRRERDERGSVVMAVVDSDRKHPGCGLGQTASKVPGRKGVVRKGFVHVLGVREAENLVSVEWIRRVLSEESEYEKLGMLQEFFNRAPKSRFFLDIKGGMSLQKYERADEAEKRFVEEVVGGDPKTTARVCGEEACPRERGKCSCMVYQGLGDRLLVRVTRLLNDEPPDIPVGDGYAGRELLRSARRVFSLGIGGDVRRGV